MSLPAHNNVESGDRWIGRLPSHWRVLPNKAMLQKCKRDVGDEWKTTQLLSLTLRGVVPRDIESGEGKYPSDFGTYQVVEPSDLVFCLFDMDETPRTVGLSPDQGMITGAYTVFQCKPSAHPAYVCYYYLHIDSHKGLRPFYSGLRKTVRPTAFLSMKMPAPPLEEQLAIANFLDRETAKIDALVAEQRRLIALLKEKRQAVISHAVTKGLNPDAPMKPSGIEWLGDVPAHWEVAPLRWYSTCRSGESTKHEPSDSENRSKLIPVVGGNGVMGRTDMSNVESTVLAVGRVGALCGNVHIIQPPAWITDNALILDGDSERFDFSYLAYLLRSRKLNDIASKTAQPLITGTQLRDQRLPAPSLNEQLEIIAYVSEELRAFSQLQGQAERAIELLQERRTALISAAVTGKIDVRESVEKEVA